MNMSKAARAAILAGGASLVALAVPAQAQDYGSQGSQRQSAPEAAQPSAQRDRQRQPARQNQAQAGQVQLNREETAAIRPFFEAVQASNWTAASAALPAAEAAAQRPQSRYFVARLKLQLGAGLNNVPMQTQAVEAMLASGQVPAELLPTVLGAQANFAIQANNIAAAEAPLTRLLELTPNNVDRIIQLGQVKVHLNKHAEALVLYRRAMQLSTAAGQTPTEDLMRRTLAVAYEGHLAQPSIELSQALVRAYPTPTNWRDSLTIYRQVGNLDPQLDLDTRRLQRAAHALTSERDYFDLAYNLSQAGLLGEAKAVIDEGIAHNALRANSRDVAPLLASLNSRMAEDRAGLAAFRTRALAGSSGREARITGDSFYSYGQFPQAVELYRAALQKGGEDANLINTRLGAALALAGQRAEAEAAFRAVTGPRATLAAYWLAWLARQS